MISRSDKTEGFGESARGDCDLGTIRNSGTIIISLAPKKCPSMRGYSSAVCPGGGGEKKNTGGGKCRDKRFPSCF